MPNGASRPSSSNQTLNVSPLVSHTSRPKYAMPASADERVSDHEQTERLAALDAENELEPDDGDEADDRRPAAKTFRILGRLAAVNARARAARAQDLVNGREGIEPEPDGSEQCADERHADPAVDPQEERAHIAVAVATEERLGHDPDPCDQADGLQAVAQPAGDVVWLADCGAGLPAGGTSELLRTMTKRKLIATASAAPSDVAQRAAAAPRSAR